MILMRGSILDGWRGGGCNEIGGKKFLPLSPKQRYLNLFYFTLLYLLSPLLDPRRKKEVIS